MGGGWWGGRGGGCGAAAPPSDTSPARLATLLLCCIASTATACRLPMSSLPAVEPLARDSRMLGPAGTSAPLSPLAPGSGMAIKLIPSAEAEGWECRAVEGGTAPPPPPGPAGAVLV